MRTIATIFALSLCFCGQGARADCTTTWIGSPLQPIGVLNSYLVNNLICGQSVPAKDPIEMGRWQELHYSDGSLRDYKEGPLDTVDPTKFVGEWRIKEVDGDKEYACYKYGEPPAATAPEYCFRFYDNGDGSFSYCSEDGTTLVANAFLVFGSAAQGGCSSYPSP